MPWDLQTLGKERERERGREQFITIRPKRGPTHSKEEIENAPSSLYPYKEMELVGVIVPTLASFDYIHIVQFGLL